jgi:hypothetical protein
MTSKVPPTMGDKRDEFAQDAQTPCHQPSAP